MPSCKFHELEYSRHCLSVPSCGGSLKTSAEPDSCHYLEKDLSGAVLVNTIMMDAISLLEKRLAALELQILPKDGTNCQQTLADSLAQVNTMISTALSGRDVMTLIFGRLNELNDYLNPAFCDVAALNITRANRAYLEAVYPDIKTLVGQIQSLKTSLPVFDSQVIQLAQSLEPKLLELSSNYSQIQKEELAITTAVVEVMQNYNNIINSINKSLIQIEEAITRLEQELNATNKTEE